MRGHDPTCLQSQIDQLERRMQVLESHCFIGESQQRDNTSGFIVESFGAHIMDQLNLCGPVWPSKIKSIFDLLSNEINKMRPMNTQSEWGRGYTQALQDVRSALALESFKLNAK